MKITTKTTIASLLVVASSTALAGAQQENQENMEGVATESAVQTTEQVVAEKAIEQASEKVMMSDVITDDTQVSQTRVNQSSEVQVLQEQMIEEEAAENDLYQQVSEEITDEMADAEEAVVTNPEKEVEAETEALVYDYATEEEAVTPVYNFERPIPAEGDVQIPVMDDARVFAEFIDDLPAVVNYYTDATEEDVIAFYTEYFDQPVEQERKRGRLTVIFYLDDISTRVVISQQDQYRQVDVLQESAAL